MKIQTTEKLYLVKPSEMADADQVKITKYPEIEEYTPDMLPKLQPASIGLAANSVKITIGEYDQLSLGEHAECVTQPIVLNETTAEKKIS